MREFLRGWRRKVGSITLMMACVFMLGWIRSLFLQDQLILPRQGYVHVLTSMNGALSWVRSSPFHFTIPVRWSSKEITGPMRDSADPWDEAEVHWKWQHWGFDFGAGTYLSRSSVVGLFERRVDLWRVPYWAITIPLTSVSAYLILWKPRKRQVTDA